MLFILSYVKLYFMQPNLSLEIMTIPEMFNNVHMSLSKLLTFASRMDFIFDISTQRLLGKYIANTRQQKSGSPV